MASFLFKKQKQEPTKGSVVIGSPTTLGSAPAPPPLYARFASTQGGADNRQSSRAAPGLISPESSPKRDSVTSGVSGRHGYSTSSLAPDRRKNQDPPVPQSTARRRIAEQQIPRPISREILDKPLPPPKDDEELFVQRMLASRGPPSSFPAQQPPDTRGRVSLDSQRQKESKQPSRPGSAQAYYPSAIAAYPSSPSRSSAASSSARQAGPSSPNRKMRPSPSPFGEKVLPTPEDPTLLPPHLRTQDFHLDRPYRNGSANAYPSMPPAPTALASQSLYGEGQDLFSEPLVDLPPEAALFQEYGEIPSVPSQPNSLNSRQGIPAGYGSNARPNPPEPILSASPSSAYSHPQSAYQDPVPSSPVQPSSPRRPLPSPPPGSMGNTPSSPTGSAMFSTAYRDLYPSHVLSSNASHYANGHNVKTPPQASYSRNQSLEHSSLSPLPSGTGLSTPFSNLTSSSMDSTPPPPPNKKPFPFPEDKRGAPDRSQTLLPQQQSSPPQTSLRKSPSVQYPAVAPVMRGKPRIFAAMEADNEPPQTTTSTFVQPNPQLSQLPQPQPLNHASEPLNARPISHMTGEEFLTPKSDFEPLPEQHLINGNHATDQHFASPDDLKTPSALPQALAFEPPTPTPPPAPEARSRKRTNSRSNNRQHEDPQKHQGPPQTPSRSRKLSKARQSSVSSFAPTQHTNGSSVVLTGTSEASQQPKPHRDKAKSRTTAPSTASSTNVNTSADPVFEPITHVDEETARNAGIPLDDDPFAKTEGVRMLKPTSPSKRSGKSVKESTASIASGHERNGSEDAPQDSVSQIQNESSDPPPSPRKSRSSKKEKTKDKTIDVPVEPQTEVAPRDPIPMVQLLVEAPIFSCLLDFLSFYEWCLMLALSKEIRLAIVRSPGLREAALERFLKTVGYSKWTWEDKEPLSLSLQDLTDYMRGVSTPTHEYARVAGMYIHSLRVHPNNRDPSLIETVQRLTASTRAYNRVLLRLRAQAEKEASVQSSSSPQIHTSRSGQFSSSNRGGNASRASSRAPSPTMSNNSHSYGNNQLPGTMQTTSSQTSLTFKSPLFRLRRAPLLRVFVPSPEGDWLSDKSVMECEAECRRAGVQPLMRIGDVVWDVAVGDEGNMGRLVWDGSYLIDLDYTYSPTGDLPKYLPALAFPPSYFHRVIRTGHTNSNPIVHIDISMWGEEVAINLQLLQDRVKTETPQGAYHNVMRWVHRSSFQVRPPRGPQRQQYGGRPPTNRVPIPDFESLFVDSGWYGTIVVETEGTNEALADLQDRCGPGAFPPRPRGVNGQPTQLQIENRKVFRVLREKSRPGEIWIRAVGLKERLI
ncbi:hypothetical protein CPB83DRAFT_891808 [Crepidotus variabilis]|uniref:Uncharacterized protein n=1 Tax=Crepidotus variabilis TaxID=179855 RepID=A0A9P6ELQ7_9AGAR|nr:hypothetical protein CPB83DRAFT_891808 [Crepidotus variabilis]